MTPRLAPAAPLLAALLLPAAAWAHTGHEPAAGPFLAGLLHPVTGADHLLAMIAVGLWAALAGGRARWACPAAFLAAMVLGGLLGMAALPWPAVEPTILASVIVLGALAAAALSAPLPLACALVAVFGLAHGHAHGAEGPGASLPYGFGFVLATAALHGLGLALGLGAARLQALAPRALGGATALAGLALVFL